LTTFFSVSSMFTHSWWPPHQDKPGSTGSSSLNPKCLPSAGVNWI